LTPDVEREEVQRLLEGQHWIYARTMPANPHHYCLRAEWASDADFVRVVEHIRAHGYRATFKGRRYVQLDLGDHFYWTMGAPIGPAERPVTVLINRKEITR
jgi:hypothetical protein